MKSNASHSHTLWKWNCTWKTQCRRRNSELLKMYEAHTLKRGINRCYIRILNRRKVASVVASTLASTLVSTLVSTLAFAMLRILHGRNLHCSHAVHARIELPNEFSVKKCRTVDWVYCENLQFRHSTTLYSEVVEGGRIALTRHCARQICSNVKKLLYLHTITCRRRLLIELRNKHR